MKRLFIAACIILSAVPSFAGNVTTVGMFGTVGASNFCDGACAGAVTFCWGISANNLTITSSDGCSVGDTTGTVNSLAALVSAPSGMTGYALQIPSSFDHVVFDVTTGDILNNASGTVQFDLIVHTWTAAGVVFVGRYDANNYFNVSLSGTDEITLTYAGNATTRSATTTAANLALDTKYTVVAKWRTGIDDPSLSITANGNTGTTNTDLTAFTSEAINMYLGSNTGTAVDSYVDNIKVWSSWQ